MDKSKLSKGLIATAAALGTAYVAARKIASSKSAKKKKELNRENPYLDKPLVKHNTYETTVKDEIDKILAFGGLVLLSPVYLIVSAAIYIDDPGPVLFSQKRVGKNKEFFELHKFRSMKMSTPHDMPTHMLANPDQYITRVGKFIRKYSIDELPQIWDILAGDMSVIGPRPALWNQDDLIAERDKYGANDIKPGLTGWAQINGRDELEIEDKAKLDGDYVAAIRSGSVKAALMDLSCFFGTIKSVLEHDGVVEGGTGEMNKNAADESGAEDYGHLKCFNIDKTRKIKVLVTGADSYIGTSFEAWAKKYYANIEVEAVDTIDGTWREKDFSGYDAVFHVAGLAHADVGNVDEATKQKYYAVNTDLAIEAAEKAKAEGVKQFVFMSSMIVYGESAGYGKRKMITAETMPSPANFYGDSKWQADKGVRALGSEDFNVAVIRPPMIYGKGSKGNYPTLAKLAKKLPVFPNVENERSMLHIDNLCEFLCQLMLSGESGIYFPQNSEYTKTSDMVKTISHVCEKNIIELKALNPFVAIGSHVPGKIKGLVNKAFGSMTYDQALSCYNGLDYRVCSLRESVVKTEREDDESASEYAELDDELVSIIMPCYNCSDFIGETIDSVLAQTYKNWELVIVDDCSTDNSYDIVSGYDDSRIRVFKNAKNSGAAVSRNEAIKNARGRWIAFLDSDDLWTEDKLEKQVDHMRRNAKTFTCTQYGKVDESGNFLDIVIDDSNIRTYRDLLKDCPGNLTVMYDAKSLGKIYAHDIKRRNDYALWFNVIRKSGELSCIPECLGYHRLRTGSISSGKLKLIKYHWHIYRNIEKIDPVKSAYYVGYWCAKGIVRKLKMR